VHRSNLVLVRKLFVSVGNFECLWCVSKWPRAVNGSFVGMLCLQRVKGHFIEELDARVVREFRLV
jgi:hypothetical protein